MKKTVSMKNRHHFVFAALLLFAVILLPFSDVQAQFVIGKQSADYYFKQNTWQDTVIAEGVIWKRMMASNFFGAPQSFNAVIIDRETSGLIPYIQIAGNELRKTTEMMAWKNATVGINGNYFALDPVRPVCFTVTDGSLIALGGTKDVLPFLQNGAVRFRDLQDFTLVEPPQYGWYLTPMDSNVLAAGPLMMYSGQDVPYPENHSFIETRHPRSAVGLLEDGRIMLFTADGRAPQAAGLSIPELHEVLREMNCIAALNLDGGGSTTLAANMSDSVHVLNHPTDNKKFDHLGERPVANALIFAPPPPPYIEVDSLYIKY